jgi:urea transport system permease protein
MIPRIFFLLLMLFGCAAHAAPNPALVRQLAAEESDDKIAAIQKLALTAEPEALAVLQQLADGSLKDDKGEDITLNNRVRRELEGALAVLKFIDPDPVVRSQGRQGSRRQRRRVDGADAGQGARRETEPKIRALLVEAHATGHAQGFRSPGAHRRRTSAGDQRRPQHQGRPQGPVRTGQRGRDRGAPRCLPVLPGGQGRLTLAENIGRVFSGLSLGSILLLAALGLAITYGVMGVINMAHGELLMIGAYATYAVQGLFRSYFPDQLDWYLLAAVPVAFFAAAAVGVLLERTVIRWLYGRALETLLATWGLSLMLIQAARVIFGAQNVEVANPSWMSGGIEILPSIVLPLNRIVIVGFALFVLALVWALMNKTRLGMFVRAVTQNRAMAGCVGVPTGRIDTVAFALGAGIAGLGGVALSQIANVGPDMGQGYIVDSFMVVVLGGVGQLAGAVWAALGLGIVTKFIEAWSGAVIAKIVVLVFIIMFIQKRPQGLFALKGRFVEN